MLPEDSVYGPWAASGEIDIFEAKGRLPQSVFGTIHFGGVCPQNTHTENQAQLPNGQRIDQFHIYELIWEPDSISWLIDGVPYAKVNQWDSIDQRIKYPAPFDQPFYLLVNLAIGGSFDLESAHPEKIRTLTEQLKRLDAAQLDSILRIVNGLVSNHPY